MKIFITCPSFAIHGGIRIILEIANRLQDLGHDVTLYNQAGKNHCDWFKIKTRISTRGMELATADCVMIMSPHGIRLLRLVRRNQKVFLHCQMMEHLFRPADKNWYKECVQFYRAPYPMFSISKWNMEEMAKLGRAAETFYIGNGVNFSDFPIDYSPGTENIVLVEGWECSNPAKDVDNIGPKVAKRLRDDGYRIVAYSALPLKTLPAVPHEYYQKPDLRTLNDLYRRATIMIKATRFDARSCAPVEAMTKGTVTARAIEKGDDDLTNGINSVRVPYNEAALYDAAHRLLNDDVGRALLGVNCMNYVRNYCNWDNVIHQINDRICL